MWCIRLIHQNQYVKLKDYQQYRDVKKYSPTMSKKLNKYQDNMMAVLDTWMWDYSRRDSISGRNGWCYKSGKYFECNGISSS